MSTDDPTPLALPPMPLDRALSILADARAPDGAAALPLARRAARLVAPLIVVAPSPPARRRLARAIHRAVEQPGPLLMGTALPRPPDGPLATLLVDAAHATETTHVWIEALADDRVVWLLIGVASPEDLPPDALVRFGGVHVEVPPLAADQALSSVRDLLRLLGERLGEAPRIDASTVLALARAGGCSDRDGLEDIVRRALVLGESGGTARPPDAAGPVDSDDVAVACADAGAPGADSGAARLEYVLAELAHELRNPLVTLQTVADHLDDLAADPELRSRFGALAGEAVARMDALLENLVTYGRLGTPVPRTVDLTGPLDAALHEAASALAERRLAVRTDTAAASAWADPEHLAFALKNLLCGIAQTAAPDGDVVVDATVNGVVRLRFASDTDAGMLQRLVAPEGHAALYDPSCQPLPFSLARAVLQRGGGSIAMVSAPDGRTAIEVHVPVPGSADVAQQGG